MWMWQRKKRNIPKTFCGFSCHFLEQKRVVVGWGGYFSADAADPRKTSLSRDRVGKERNLIKSSLNGSKGRRRGKKPPFPFEGAAASQGLKFSNFPIPHLVLSPHKVFPARSPLPLPPSSSLFPFPHSGFQTPIKFC